MTGATGTWSNDEEDGASVLDGLFPGLSGKIAQATEDAAAQAEKATRSAYINKLPGAGVLFSHDLDAGFSLTPLGQWIALGLGAYGLMRLAGK